MCSTSLRKITLTNCGRTLRRHMLRLLSLLSRPRRCAGLMRLHVLSVILYCSYVKQKVALRYKLRLDNSFSVVSDKYQKLIKRGLITPFFLYLLTFPFHIGYVHRICSEYIIIDISCNMGINISWRIH